MGRVPRDDAERPLISACLVIYHEERLLERALRSVVPVADEIIVVHDGPCHDRSLEIAERLGATVIVGDRRGNCEEHTVTAYEAARGTWLLNLDADEYLSPELQAEIPRLVERDDVNAFRFQWRRWTGEQYTTEYGPFKLALFRRHATHLLGLMHRPEEIDGAIVDVPLDLEHRPTVTNFSLRSMATKWRRWARTHARQLTTPWAEIPKFQWTGARDWPWYRGVLNVLSPVALPLYVPAFFLNMLRLGRREGLPSGPNLHNATFSTVYATMTQLFVVWEMYGPRGRAWRRVKAGAASRRAASRGRSTAGR